MLKNMIIAVSVTTLTLISLPTIVLAVEGVEIDPSEDVMQITQTNTTEQETSESGTRQERIKSLKDKSTERINASEIRRIEARCVNAQQKLTNLSVRLADSLERRTVAYQNITSRLNELLLKLQVAGVDTSELELAVNEMTSILNESIASADNFVQNLSDVTEVECVSDPEAFKLLLDEARQRRVEIVSFQSEIQAVKNEKVKPILQSIRESLSPESVNEEIEE